MPDLYYKVDSNGKLIYVDEKHGRYTYVFPKTGDPDLILETAEQVTEYILGRIQSPGWSYYD